MEVEIIGSELRAARLQRELSLEEVEQELRIRAKFLRAIEAGDYSVLPSHVQARGFLRNYATFLGEDANAILARYEQAMHDLDPDRTHGHLPQPAPVVVAKPAETSYPEATLAPLPSPEGSYTTTTIGQNRRRRQTLSSTLVMTGVAVVALFFVLAWGGTQLVEALIAADRSVGAEAGIDQFIEGIMGDQLSPTPSATFVPSPTPSPGVPVAAMIPVDEDKVVVVFDVTQRNWIRISVDGEIAFEGIAKPGERLQYQGDENISVRTGNAAGLDMTLNGTAVGPLGARGEIYDSSFTPGMSFEQDEPVPEATATPTPPPGA